MESERSERLVTQKSASWKRWGVSVLCLVVLIVLLVVFVPDWAVVDPAGFYLTEGGMNYVEIGRDPKGELIAQRVRYGGDPFGIGQSGIAGQFSLKTDGHRLVVRWDALRFIPHPQKAMEAYIDKVLRLYHVKKKLPRNTDFLFLKASKDSPGHWDLTHMTTRQGIQTFPEPIRYLRRADDPRLVNYFTLQDEEENARTAWKLAADLLTAHPGDLWIRTLYLDSLAAGGDADELEDKLNTWEKDYLADPNPWMKEVVRRSRRLVRAIRAEQAGRNAAAEFADFWIYHAKPYSQLDLKTFLEKLPNVLDYEVYLPHGRGFRQFDPFVPNYLPIQTIAKTFTVLANLRLLEGRRDEALKLAATIYQMGQFLTLDGTLICRLIGFHIRSIASGALLIQALNACESEEEFQQLWACLEQFQRNEKRLTRQDLIDAEGKPWSQLMPSFMSPDLLEAKIRAWVADAKFQLLRMATAARYRLVTTGVFPDSQDAFTPLLHGGPPSDPFAKEPLRFFLEDDWFVCYSIGPDRTDDRARIPYDPTNGTASVGDVFVKIPRQREFPFPRESVGAATAHDLLKQFPNGLPHDVFADTKSRSLSVTNTQPVYVFSFGPDKDAMDGTANPVFAWDSRINQWVSEEVWSQNRPRPAYFGGAPPGVPPGPPQRPEVFYDPTNGTVSDGDLFITIPGRRD